MSQMKRARLREAAGWVIAALFALCWWRARSCPHVWNGGAPGGSPLGSCWVGPDEYAMCTPSLAIDLVIERGDGESVLLVERADNGLFATMGGFVDVGETLHDAVARELLEETGLTLARAPQLLGVYGDPRRDPRRHTVSAAYVARADGAGAANSDARGVREIPVADLAALDNLAFDHRAILDDYLRWRRRRGGARPPADTEPFRGGAPIARDACA